MGLTMIVGMRTDKSRIGAYGDRSVSLLMALEMLS